MLGVVKINDNISLAMQGFVTPQATTSSYATLLTMKKVSNTITMKGLDLMYGYLKFSKIRWCVNILFASALALSLFSMHSTSAFAAACNPATPLDASASSASCDMAIAAQVSAGVLTLANDAAAVVTGTPFTLTGAPIVAPFVFTSVVKDHRGSTAGWVLSAASAGVVNGTTTIPVNFTAKDPASTCVNGTCASTTFTAITLTTTATRFLTTGNASYTIVVDGDYTNKTDGTFTIPAGSPAGAYTGIITITLSNTF
jgi:hypothetical protein